MRIAIVCNDTRGGVQPYAALAAGLREAGHDVRTVAPADLTFLFDQAGIPVAPLTRSAEQMEGLIAGVAERGTLAAMRLAARELPKRIALWTRETLAACEGADLVTGGVGGMIVGLSVADRLGVPFVETHLQPVGYPTAAYPGPLFASVPGWLGAWGRRLSHHVSDLGIWLPFRAAMRSARRDVLGLCGRPMANLGQPVLYGFSRHAVPMPPDPARERLLTGYWSLPVADGWSPSPELAGFLAAEGSPVVCIGFGSMASARPEEVTDLVLGAVRDAGARAILLSGWGGLRDVPPTDRVYCAASLPHAWLFPRVAAAVHHCGAGTTGAALSAGTPSVPVPFTMDQPFWAERIASLGAGTVPIARSRLTRQRLAEALRQVTTDHAMKHAASVIGERIRAEDGVGAAVARFSRF